MELERLFKPKSVAIVGASRKPGKVGFTVLKNLLDLGYQGKIYPVNPKYDEVLGLKAYPSMSSLPETVDVAVIATPAPTVPSIVEEGKAKAYVILSGGFGEVGNKELEERLKKVGQGKVIVGPNCLGIMSPLARFDTIFFPLHKMERPLPGDVAIVTQSGGIGTTLVSRLVEEGVGISTFISYGNAYFLEEWHFLEYLAKDERTKVVVLYVEGVKNGKAFRRALQKLRKAGKAVVALKAGKREEAKEAAKTHTGSLAGSYEAYKAIFRKERVVEVSTFEGMVDAIKALRLPLPKSNRLGVITNGGGLGVLSADALERLELAELSPETVEKLRESLPPYATPANPLDVIADADSVRYAIAIEAFVKDPNVDMLLVNVLFQSPAVDETLIKPLLWAAEEGKPIAAVVPGGEDVEPYREMIARAGIPIYNDPARAVKALELLWEHARFLQKGPGVARA